MEINSQIVHVEDLFLVVFSHKKSSLLQFLRVEGIAQTFTNQVDGDYG